MALSLSHKETDPLDNLIGLGRIKQLIRRAIASARIRRVPMGHCIFTGLGGTGKTTLARGIAQALGCHFVETEAAELKTRDHVNALILRADNEAKARGRSLVLFIDELHRLSDQESLYYPMKEQIVNRGQEKKSINAFTLIGATTRSDMLDQGSLVTRFQNVWDIGRYDLCDMEQIVAREMMRNGVFAAPLERTAVAKRCLGIPRLAVNMVEKVRDQVLYAHPADLRVRREDVVTIFSLEDIDEIGLSRSHLNYMVALLSSNGQPKGIAVLAAILGRQKCVVEDVVEPILISLGFVSATPRGRVLTEKGYRHLATQGLA